MDKPTQEYAQNISGTLSELEDLVEVIKSKVLAIPPISGQKLKEKEPYQNKAEEINNRIKNVNSVLKETLKGLELF